MNIPVMVFAPKDIEGIISDIKLLGSITGADSKAQQLAIDIKTRLDTIAEKTQGVSKPTRFLGIR